MYIYIYIYTHIVTVMIVLCHRVMSMELPWVRATAV